MPSPNSRVMGSSAITVGAGLWGFFWIPLRYLDQNNIQGLWAVALTLSAALIIGIPLSLWRGNFRKSQLKSATMIGMGIGLSMVLYFSAVIFSDVIRVIFLFYVLPVWATLTSWVLYRETVRPKQAFAIILALIGILTLLGGGDGVPIPQNIGDWFALFAGFLWGLSLTLIRAHPDVDPFANATIPFIFGVPLAVLVGLMIMMSSSQSSSELPSLTNIAAALPLIILFGCLFLWPSMYAQVWGARLVPSSTAALFTMMEILVATASAWFLIGNTLSTLSIFGGVLIIAAAVLDLASGDNLGKIQHKETSVGDL